MSWLMQTWILRFLQRIKRTNKVMTKNGQSRRKVLMSGAAIVAAAAIPTNAISSTDSQSQTSPVPTGSGSTITTKDGTQIYYKDWGTGQPLFFHHGWPLSADDWDGQMMFFLERGYRVIAHDRRGHGRSTQTVTGTEMNTYAADENHLVKKLDLREAIHI